MVILYSAAALKFETVNALLKYLFEIKAKPLTSLPPTSYAPALQTFRALYQAGHIRGQVDSIITHIPSPDD